MKLFKFSLLITPLTANLPKRFPVFMVFLTKLQNTLAPKTTTHTNAVNLIGTSYR